jgi:hypothetical protein
VYTLACKTVIEYMSIESETWGDSYVFLIFRSVSLESLAFSLDEVRWGYWL